MNLNYDLTPDQLTQFMGSGDGGQDSHTLYVLKNGEICPAAFRSDTVTGAEYANENTRSRRRVFSMGCSAYNCR